MKPKEYIEKYGIQGGWNPKRQQEFLSDLTSELLAFCEYNKAENNIKGFDNSVKVIRMKWDAISNKIRFGLPEGMWRYFYATVIVKVREELCPADVARREKEREERRAEWERRKKMKEQERLFWDELYREAMYERIALLSLFLSDKSVSSFKYMGLPSTATEDEIRKRYREMSLACHPDKGGKQEEFVLLTEHKNKCISWAKKNKF